MQSSSSQYQPTERVPDQIDFGRYFFLLNEDFYPLHLLDTGGKSKIRVIDET